MLELDVMELELLNDEAEDDMELADDDSLETLELLLCGVNTTSLLAFLFLLSAIFTTIIVPTVRTIIVPSAIEPQRINRLSLKSNFIPLLKVNNIC